MKTQQTLPYNFVLIPRLNSEDAHKFEPVRLANALSSIKSDNVFFEVIDFESLYSKFINQPDLTAGLKNERHFIEVSKAIFVKQNSVVFIANFDMNDTFLIIEKLSELIGDCRFLLAVYDELYTTWQLIDRPQDVDVCIHNGIVNKTLMQKLGMI